MDRCVCILLFSGLLTRLSLGARFLGVRKQGSPPEQKVVVNRCFGGFGLSDAAIRRYAELKGLTLYPENGPYGFIQYWTSQEKDDSIYDGDIPRDDPALVQAVEELGKLADGPHAYLEVVSFPAGVQWRIDEYDGQETVAEGRRW